MCSGKCIAYWWAQNCPLLNLHNPRLLIIQRGPFSDMSVGLDYLFVIAHKRNYSIHISTNPIKFPCLLIGNDAVIAGWRLHKQSLAWSRLAWLRSAQSLDEQFKSKAILQNVRALSAQPHHHAAVSLGLLLSLSWSGTFAYTKLRTYLWSVKSCWCRSVPMREVHRFEGVINKDRHGNASS